MQGKCLCGAVSVTAPDQTHVDACHCSMCRRWSGGPFFGVQGGTDVQVVGEHSVYQSSDWAERGFCAKCGTHLFYRLTDAQHYILPAGLFQQQAFEFAQEVFIDEKPVYYDFKNDTEKLTGEQLFAMFGA